MKIRQAIREDAVGIAAVVETIKELRSVASIPFECTANTIAQNLERLVASTTSTAYVAEDPKGTIAGYCAVHWLPFLFLPGGEAYLTELFVKPEGTGMGYGTKLLDTVVAEARRRGCTRLSLLNGRHSEAYKREFYRKRGWVERDHMANFVLSLVEESKQPVAKGDSIPSRTSDPP